MVEYHSHRLPFSLFSFTNSATQGVTRMLLTIIPYFKEVILMSFKCDHCGNNNTEIQSAGEIQRRSARGVFSLSTTLTSCAESHHLSQGMHSHRPRSVPS